MRAPLGQVDTRACECAPRLARDGKIDIERGKFFLTEPGDGEIPPIGAQPPRFWSDAMFLHVVEARHVRDYVVWLRFSDGAAGEVDLSDELEGPVFGSLRNVEEFRRLSVAYNTLTWPNGADFAPEFLRERVAATV